MTTDEIRAVNQTCRTRGAVGANAIVPRVTAGIVTSDERILDYGAGREAIHTAALRILGLDVTAWEIGENFTPGVHDPSALERHYDTVMVSNVFNILPNMRAVLEVIQQVAGLGNVVVYNIPTTPRRVEGIVSIVRAEFGLYDFEVEEERRNCWVARKRFRP